MIAWTLKHASYQADQCVVFSADLPNVRLACSPIDALLLHRQVIAGDILSFKFVPDERTQMAFRVRASSTRDNIILLEEHIQTCQRNL